MQGCLHLESFCHSWLHEGKDMYAGEKIVPIKLDLRVNHTLINDQFLLDLKNFESNPEEFARTFCEVMGREDPEVGVSRNTGSSRTDANTDLRLGLSLSTYQPGFSNSILRDQTSDWPPIKSILKSNLVEKQNPSLFVKVYLEGIPIGRKLNLLAHHSYDGLVRALCDMFQTTILCPNSQPLHSRNFHVLTYEDQEGDWMMVGDVPWEMFLTSVKRLKITRADRC